MPGGLLLCEAASGGAAEEPPHALRRMSANNPVTIGAMAADCGAASDLMTLMLPAKNQHAGVVGAGG